MQPPFGLETEPRLLALEASFLAVYKPSRLHSASLDRGGGPSLTSWVFERFPETAEVLLEGGAAGQLRPPREGGLVHRLDFETSGLVLFARTAQALRHFLAEQAAGGLQKTYRALALPSPAGLQGSRPTLGWPAGLEEAVWKAAVEAAAAGAAAAGAAAAGTAATGAAATGAAAASVGAELESLAALLAGRLIQSRFRPFGPGASRVACQALGALDPRPRRRGSPERAYETLVVGARSQAGGLELELRILRGFRHQIRAQLAWLGLPLLGDRLYSGAEAPRLCLHAARLDFRHPETGLPCRIEC